METTIARRGRKSNTLDYSLLPNQARRLREEKGYSLRAISRKINAKSWNSLSEFETTGKGIGDARQYALAIVLGTDIATLLTPGEKYAEISAKKFASEVQYILDNVQ